MRLKTFLAKDMKTALAAVRAELGEDAVIIASQKAKDGGIMVRAAVEEDAPAREAQAADAGGAPLALNAFEARYHDGLVARLREAPSAPKRSEPNVAVDRASLLGLLRTQRTPDPRPRAWPKMRKRAG